ncbi:protein mono-ADP-ribosyltransferase PARP12-like [Engraulis encrasicolus]|uniref:protein mono-ADP-ribosyltransferase PARP12-like n=1 Tax=Engraulis encrasicolus TaxID=184585 RepID=UPI002FD0D4FA
MQGTAGPTAESLVYKATCAHGGHRELSALTQELSGQLPSGELDRALGDKQLFAVTCGADGQKTVVAKTSVRLCRARECGSDCSNVHLCKFYLLGEDCPHNRGRRVCRFSHDLYSDHNSRLLRQHHLQDLQREELCTLLLQNDGTLLPQVCFTYNRGSGEFGFCPDKDGCRRLHVCENYLRGTCHTGDCDRSHDFFEPHPMRALQGRSLSSGMVASLLPVFRNVLAMRDSTNQGAHGKPREPEICLYHIKSFCKQGNRCVKVHFHLPYRWEFKDGQGWSMLTDNEAIERDYCQPSKTYSGGSYPVHFDTMTRNSAEVRRVSTVSAATQPNFLLTTRWLWYWEDEFGHWTQYATSEGGQHSSSITCEELEKRYVEDNSSTVEFTAGKHTYQLSMQDMIQSNKRFGTKRLVRRRPVFVSAADVQRIKTSSVQGPRGLPRHWDKQDMPETGFKRVKLDFSSQECTAIVDLFSKTMSGYLVTSIERVQNRALWDVFQWQSDQMRKSNSGSTNEKILFHGTDAKHIDAICQQNFDWRLCGTHGTAYGKGSYFARDAEYSHKYTSPSAPRCMFACRVLLGRSTRGRSSYVRPPPREDNPSALYDSCVNSMSDPSIFVVFEKHQVYPEYLIQYREKADPAAAILESERMPPQHQVRVSPALPDVNVVARPADTTPKVVVGTPHVYHCVNMARPADTTPKVVVGTPHVYHAVKMARPTDTTPKVVVGTPSVPSSPSPVSRQDCLLVPVNAAQEASAAVAASDGSALSSSPAALSSASATLPSAGSNENSKSETFTDLIQYFYQLSNNT